MRHFLSAKEQEELSNVNYFAHYVLRGAAKEAGTDCPTWLSMSQEERDIALENMCLYLSGNLETEVDLKRAKALCRHIDEDEIGTWHDEEGRLVRERAPKLRIVNSDG